MAKTISEMALEVYPKIIKGNGWCEYDVYEKERKGFRIGANAVLDEINKFIYEKIQMEDLTPYMIIGLLKRKFKELQRVKRE